MISRAVFVILFAGAVMASGVSAATGEDLPIHGHSSLGIDPQLSLAAVIDHAVEAYPATIELAAQAREADAWTKRGRRWLADSPALTFRYQSDRWGDDNRLEEFEAGIELPMWRWGGRRATRSLGQSMVKAATNSAGALRWSVAGRVRGALWAIALAENDLELAEANAAITERLSQMVMRRYELGDVPLRDLLLAQTSVLDAQSNLIESRAALLDAERGYRSLTGLQARPAVQVEAISKAQTVGPEHPAVRATQSQIKRAQDARRVGRAAARGAPVLLVGPRRERAAFGQSSDDSIGLSLRLPFGGRVHTRAQVTAAERAVAAAEAEHARLLRELDLQMHEAAHALAVISESLTVATKHSELASQQYTLGQRAYQLGELGLMDLLKLQRTSLAATRAVMRLETDRQRHTALFNQAVGNVP